MNTAHEKVIAARILKLYDRYPHDAWRSRELRSKLDIVDEAEFQAMRRVLHAMADNGELVYNKAKGYQRPISGAHVVTGTLMITKAGMGFVSVA
jgi:exoribonuclease R